MKVSLLRANSVGVDGTYKNAHHHAKALIALLDFLKFHISNQTAYEKWVQGSNVHLLVTPDGRTFVLRPVHEPGGYVGIRFFLRISRSQEIPLAFLHHDRASSLGMNWNAFAELLSHLPQAVGSTAESSLTEDRSSAEA